MTHCGEGRGVGMRPANQRAPLYAGVAEPGCNLLMRQQSSNASTALHACGVWQNPAAWLVQKRVQKHVAMAAGNTCEPWMARFAIVMLDQLLNTGGISSIHRALLGHSRVPHV